MKGYLLSLFSNDIYSIQDSFRHVVPPPKGAVVERSTVKVNAKAISFMKTREFYEWPDVASNSVDIECEWIYDKNVKDSGKVILYLHG